MLKYSQSAPYIPHSWGTFLNLGDTPRPPPESILLLFFNIVIMLSQDIGFVPAY
jgi:hypothetical protein